MQCLYQVQDLFFLLAELFFLLAELWEIDGDLCRELHAVSGWAGEAEKASCFYLLDSLLMAEIFPHWVTSSPPHLIPHHLRIFPCWKCRYVFEKSPFRARVYTVFISRNKYSPLHTGRVFCWYSSVLTVKALIFKPSHGRWMLVKGWNGKPSQRKSVENQWKTTNLLLFGVNTWKSKPSRLKHLKTKRKEPSCEGVNAFFEDKKAYSRGWNIEVVCCHSLRMLVAGVIQLPKRCHEPASALNGCRICKIRENWQWGIRC